MNDDLDKVLRASAPAFFNRDSRIGDTVSGTIVATSVEQMMEFKNGERTDVPAKWDNGDPMNQIRVVLQTSLRDSGEDDGQRSVFIKTWGVQKAKLLEAVKAADYTKLSEALAEGNTFTDTYVRDEQGKAPSPAKVHEYVIGKGNPALDAVATTPEPAASAPARGVDEAKTAASDEFAQARQLIKLGLTDEQIGETLGMLPLIVSKVREQEVAPY